MQEVAADVVSSVTHRSGGQADSCGGRGRPTASRSEFRRRCPAVDVTLV